MISSSPDKLHWHHPIYWCSLFIHLFTPSRLLTARWEAGCWQHSFSEYPQDGLSSSLVSAPVERPCLTSSSNEGPCPHSLTWFLPGLDIRKYHCQGPSEGFNPLVFKQGSGHHCFPNLPGRLQHAGRAEAEDHSSFSLPCFPSLYLMLPDIYYLKTFFLPVFPTRKHFS